MLILTPNTANVGKNNNDIMFGILIPALIPFSFSPNQNTKAKIRIGAKTISTQMITTLIIITIAKTKSGIKSAKPNAIFIKASRVTSATLP